MSIAFNRPEKKNAITQNMYQAINDALIQADSDDDIHVVMFSGNGDCFTAGNEISDFLKSDDLSQMNPTIQMLLLLAEFKKPIVAAVHGNAIGVGTTMLLHCDLVVAATDCVFAMPFIPLGICPEAASTLLLPRLAGYQQAAELLFLGEAFNSDKAHQIGLLNRVVDKREVKFQAMALCQKISSLPVRSIQLTKQLLKSPNEAISERIIKESGHLKELLKSPDAKRAFQAFLSK
jgi:enoyl-CoA hydratase/carnithine racemase